MAVTGFLYAHFIESLLEADMNKFSTAVYKCILTTDTYTPNQDTHQDHADITNEVANGDGYTTGGATIAGLAVTQTLNVVKVDGTDISWAASSITARRAVIYDDTEAASGDKKLVGWIDFGEDKVSENGTFQITLNAGGIFTITVGDA